VTLSAGASTFASRMSQRLPPTEKRRHMLAWMRLSAAESERGVDRELQEVLEREEMTMHEEMLARDIYLCRADQLGQPLGSTAITSVGGTPAIPRALWVDTRGMGGFMSPRRKPTLEFAYGGVVPGPKARGRVLDSHDVYFSVGVTGTYLLHVSLRAQGGVPGSPFLLTVAPAPAHPLLTQIQLPLRGHIEPLGDGPAPPAPPAVRQDAAASHGGFSFSRAERVKRESKDLERPERSSVEDAGASVHMTLASVEDSVDEEPGAEAHVRGTCTSLLLVRDRLGNACVEGGSNVTCGFTSPPAGAMDSDYTSSVADLGDGTYQLSWQAAAAGSYTVFVRLDGMHVLGSPAILRVEERRPSRVSHTHTPAAVASRETVTSSPAPAA